MNETKGARLADRLKTAAEARQALLAKFKPKPAAADPLFAERGVEAAAQLKAVRAERQAVRSVRREAAQTVAAVAAAASAEAGQRAERKRKVPTEAEAKDKRDAKYAARKSRQ